MSTSATTGTKALAAQVKPLYGKRKRVPPGKGSGRWSSQNKPKKR